MDGRGRFLQSLTTALFGVRRAQPRAGMVEVPLLTGERSGRGAFWPFGARGSVQLPLHERLPRRLGVALTCAGFALIGVSGAIHGGEYDRFQREHGDLRDVIARAVGLGVDRITISGLVELHPNEVLEVAGIDPKISTVFFDASQARERLAGQPLIEEASVRKLFPGEIAIQLKEREAFALWQLNGEISIISSDGTVIDQMRDSRFAHLPLVVGPEANLRAREYVALLAEAGALRNRIRGATLVSGRRWTLKLDNGLDVRMPEIGVTEAMRRLDRLAREDRILDKDVIAIDMRQPDRVTLRLTEEAAAARAEQIKSRPKPRGGAA